MKKNIFPLEPERIYHIYNRGINGGQLFFNHQNYLYFLKLVAAKINPIAKVYSYCLLQNHFHILLEIRSETIIRQTFPEKEKTVIHHIISHQFSNAFNSYSQAVNKHFGRTGKLFELPFRRKEITSSQQLMNTVLYINKNPVKHKITNNFLTYPYSSVDEIINNKSVLVESDIMLSLFNNTDAFIIALRDYRV